ncbi:MAG: GTPase Era [Candidatus Methylumidiphilus alinenensis]|uniref:GTPase Era n=1 Tax=Candidatus Methylumidiphilus alinenensis TaxID=2202197 RepID=A0A2W4QGB1_9GAMM|nr:MAG: GTPase Era [Candidatus Methylumidiphilus alinenensis]
MKVGYIALVGRPNAGKSTLLNHLVGQKICITSRRPQTTRHRIHGIKTTPAGQAIFVDTPGIHAEQKKAMNRYLNKTASSALAGVDVIVWVVDSWKWHEENEVVLAQLRNANCPVILAINKIDQCEDKEALLPFLDSASKRFGFAAIVPISALKNINLDRLEETIMGLLPEGGLIFPEDQVTDRTERFFAAEIIREKLIRSLGQEVPHAIAVQVESYKEEEKLTRIHAIIWVEREGQKAIVIGKEGEVLKKVGQRAREEMEKMFERKVYLNLWVKVKKGWSDNEGVMQSLGYNE